MTNSTNLDEERGAEEITTKQRDAFAKGQARKPSIAMKDTSGAKVDHKALMVYVSQAKLEGRTSFKFADIHHGLKLHFADRGHLRTLLLECKFLGAVRREGAAFIFTKSGWSVPDWSRFSPSRKAVPVKMGGASVIDTLRSGMHLGAKRPVPSQIVAIASVKIWYWLLIAALTGIGLIALFVAPQVQNGTYGLRDMMNIIAGSPIMAIMAISCIVGFISASVLASLKGIQLLVMYLDASRHRLVPGPRVVADLDATPLREENGDEDEAEAEEFREELQPSDAITERLPVPPSAISSGVFGETTAMGDPIPVLAAKLGHSTKPIAERAATAIEGGIFCSLVFKLHEGKREDEASQLVASLIPAGSVADDRVITELAARSTSRFRTVTGVDARMVAEGVASRPSPASSMRVYADPSLLDQETLLVPAQVPGKWYAIPSSRLRGEAVELRRVTSSIFKEPELRTRLDANYVAALPTDKGKSRGYDGTKGGAGWREQDVRGNIAAPLFQEAARKVEAGIKPKRLDYDPGRLDVTLSGVVTPLTNTAISTLMKRGYRVVVTCSVCGAGPDSLKEIALLDDESAHELERAFRAPTLGLCSDCLSKHDVRVVEDKPLKDPAMVLIFLRDRDDLGKHPWSFEALTKELGLFSDRAKRRLSAYLSELENGHDVRTIEGKGYIFMRCGHIIVYEGLSQPEPCKECGVVPDTDTNDKRTRVRLNRDTWIVLGKIKGASVPLELCEACASRYEVDVQGYERVTIS